MSTVAATAPIRSFSGRPASGRFAWVRRLLIPAGENATWTIGPDGLPCAEWIAPAAEHELSAI